MKFDPICRPTRKARPRWPEIPQYARRFEPYRFGHFHNWRIRVIPDLEWLIEEVERSGIAAAIEKTETYSLQAARSRIATIVEKNVSRADLRQPSLTYGYSLVADAGPAGESRQMGLWIKAGRRVNGWTWLQTGDYKVLPDSALVTYPLFKAALLAINATSVLRLRFCVQDGLRHGAAFPRRRIVSLFRLPHSMARLFVGPARIRT